MSIKALYREYAELTETLSASVNVVLLPSMDELHQSVLNEIDAHDDAQARKDFILGFADFESFFNWFDTTTHYDQEDCGLALADHKPWLELVYRRLILEFTPHFKFMLSQNLGMSYSEIYRSHDLQDPKFQSMAEHYANLHLRFYIADENDGVVGFSPIHAATLDHFVSSAASPYRKRDINEQLADLRAHFKCR